MKQLNSLVNNTILKIIKIITFRKLESTILKYFIPPIIFIISQKIETMYKVYGFSKTFNLLNIKRKKLFYQHELHLNHNSIEKRMISELNTNGIATANIYDFFPDENILSDIQSFFEEKKRQNSESDRVGYFFKYVNSLKINNENNCINNYVLNRSLIKISSNYLGLLPVFCGGSLMENFPHKGARISSQLWHRDKHDRKIIKIFLYLTDVDSKNEPFEYITKTHVNGKFWKNFRTIERLTDSELKGKNSEILSYKKICTGKAGDIIFVDTTGIHRGGRVQEGRRKIVDMYHFTKNSNSPKFFTISDDFIPENNMTKDFLDYR